MPSNEDYRPQVAESLQDLADKLGQYAAAFRAMKSEEYYGQLPEFHFNVGMALGTLHKGAGMLGDAVLPLTLPKLPDGGATSSNP